MDRMPSLAGGDQKRADRSMQIVEWGIALVALVAAGILAVIR